MMKTALNLLGPITGVASPWGRGSHIKRTGVLGVPLRG